MVISLDFLSYVDWKHLQTLDGVSFVPVRGAWGAPPGYLLLKEALASGKFTISEVSGAGSVPHLLATNNLDIPVLLMEGEEVIGGKQNRILNTTVLVAAHAKVTLPVSCVERGRWNHASTTHTHSGRIIDKEIRFHKIADMAANPQARRQHRSDQNLVWQYVDKRLKEERLVSMTDAAYEIYAKRREELMGWKSELTLYDDQFGFAVLNGTSLIGIELLVPAQKFKAQFDTLIDSYLIELNQLPPATGALTPGTRDLRALLGESLEESIVQGVSLGKNVYVVWQKHVGHGLLVDEQLIQFSILSGRGEKRRSSAQTART